MSDDKKETYEEQQQPPKVASQLLEDAYLCTLVIEEELKAGAGSSIEALGQRKSNNDRGNGAPSLETANHPTPVPTNCPMPITTSKRPAIPDFTMTMSDDRKETYEERQARAVPSRSLEDTYLKGFFTKKERKAGGIVEATIPYAASSSAVQTQQHYEIREIDDGDEMEIDDDQKKEEKWRNPETFTFEKYFNEFSPIKPKPEDEEDTVAMIVESDPIKRAEALLNKAFHTVTFASPTNNPVYLQGLDHTGGTNQETE